MHARLLHQTILVVLRLKACNGKKKKLLLHLFVWISSVSILILFRCIDRELDTVYAGMMSEITVITTFHRIY